VAKIGDVGLAKTMISDYFSWETAVGTCKFSLYTCFTLQACLSKPCWRTEQRWQQASLRAQFVPIWYLMCDCLRMQSHMLRQSCSWATSAPSKLVRGPLSTAKLPICHLLSWRDLPTAQ
jgi:hypothetical protein